ncbi:MAG: helix-turn-helix transcriptional regulator [Clostridia bacterium]|nr:helix-turn-helix transcriptional regulator [Clostridia bacterium]
MINNNLIMLRDQHKFSQEKVAEMLGVSRQTYSRWEKGSALPDIGQLPEVES